ncbi:MAG: response regulator transcription factor [Sphingomonadaceae bacterium]
MPDASSNPHYIAIVDDDAQVRLALGSLLRSYGYLTRSYDSAGALLASPQLAAYDCVISDLQMPGMTGLELLEQLRRQGSALPLVMMTAYPEEALRRRALQGGATCFLSKPFEANDLIRCLRDAHGCCHPSTQE